MHNQLINFPWPTVLVSQGYRFHVITDRGGGESAISPLGMHAAFRPPSSRAGAVNAQPLLTQVREKVRTYGQLADA